MNPRRRLLLFAIPILALVFLAPFLFQSHGSYSHHQATASTKKRSTLNDDSDPRFFETAAKLLRRGGVSVVPAALFPPIGHDREVHEQFLIMCAGEVLPSSAVTKKPRNGTKTKQRRSRPRDVVCRDLAASGRFEAVTAKRIAFLLSAIVTKLQREHIGGHFDWSSFLEQEEKKREERQNKHPAEGKNNSNSNKKKQRETESADELLARYAAEQQQLEKKKKQQRLKKHKRSKRDDDDDEDVDGEDDDIDAVSRRVKRVFIDVGANVGAHTFSLAPLFSSVIAVDAVHHNVDMMSASRVINLQYEAYKSYLQAAEDRNPKNFKSLAVPAAPSTRDVFSSSHIEVINAALSSPEEAAETRSGSSPSSSFCLPMSVKNNVNNFELLCSKKGGAVPAKELAELEVGDTVPERWLSSVDAANDQSSVPRYVRSRRRIRFTTLDQLLEPQLQQLSSAVVVLKIDVEGRELDVLRGASRLLNSGPAIVVAEQTRSNPKVLDVFKLMASRHYVALNALTGLVIPPDSYARYIETSMSAIENIVFLSRDVASFLCQERRDPMFHHVSLHCGPSYVADEL